MTRIWMFLAKAGVVTAALVLFWRYGVRAPDGVKAAAAPAAEVATVRAGLETSRAQVAGAERVAVFAAQAVASEQATHNDAALVVPPEAALEPTPVTSTVHTSAEEVRVTLDSRFGTESSDPKWSRATSVLIDSHIHSGLPGGSQVTSVECHTTLCRVESKHANLTGYRKFVDEALLFPKGGWSGPIITQILNPGAPDKEVVSVAYLLREGQDISEIAQ